MNITHCFAGISLQPATRDECRLIKSDMHNRNDRSDFELTSAYGAGTATSLDADNRAVSCWTPPYTMSMRSGLGGGTLQGALLPD
jgi:hypothetical protein